MFRPLLCKKHWLRSLAALLAASACTSASRKLPSTTEPQPSGLDPREVIVVALGESLQPAYSADGSKLIFVSSLRPSHAHAQVYERDLTSGEERRLTFQNGSTSFPAYHPKGGVIVYSSTTDESKEYPALLYPDQGGAKLPQRYRERTEVYLHSLERLDVTRVTSRPGFDGEARFSRDGASVFFTRASGDTLEVVTYNRSSGTLLPIRRLGKNVSQFVMSNDGKLSAWVAWDPGFAEPKLMLQKGNSKPEAIPGGGRRSDLIFSPDGKYLLWSQQNMVTALFSLWSYEMATGCARELPFEPGSERRHPVISPDGKWLTYTLVHASRSRIAQVPWTPESGPCSPAP